MLDKGDGGPIAGRCPFMSELTQYAWQVDSQNRSPGREWFAVRSGDAKLRCIRRDCAGGGFIVLCIRILRSCSVLLAFCGSCDGGWIPNQ
jgi:hypothetical protein